MNSPTSSSTRLFLNPSEVTLREIPIADCQDTCYICLNRPTDTILVHDNGMRSNQEQDTHIARLFHGTCKPCLKEWLESSNSSACGCCKREIVNVKDHFPELDINSRPITENPNNIRVPRTTFFSQAQVQVEIPSQATQGITHTFTITTRSRFDSRRSLQNPNSLRRTVIFSTPSLGNTQRSQEAPREHIPPPGQ